MKTSTKAAKRKKCPHAPPLRGAVPRHPPPTQPTMPPLCATSLLFGLLFSLLSPAAPYDGSSSQRWDLVSNVHEPTYRPYNMVPTSNEKRSALFVPDPEILARSQPRHATPLHVSKSQPKNLPIVPRRGPSQSSSTSSWTKTKSSRANANGGSSSTQNAASQTTGTPGVKDVFSKISLQIYCDIDTTLCNNVANALAKATTDLNAVINLVNPVVVCARYYSFCTTGCANGTLGWAAPATQWTLPHLENVDPDYLYPQSLAKQLVPLNNSMDWNACDIKAEFNHDAYMNGTQPSSNSSNTTSISSGGLFWFPTDTTPIRSDQVDMTYLILHELLHGFGFISSWGSYFLSPNSPYNDFLGSVLTTDQLKLITPTPISTTDSNGIYYMSGFLPSMIFDKYLIGIDPANASSPAQSLGTLGSQIQAFCFPGDGAFILDFVKALLNSTTASTAARLIWRIVNSNDALFFQYPSGEVSPFVTFQNLTMYTASNTSYSADSEETTTNFRPGVSISHVDDLYLTTTEFLMRTTPAIGITLEDLAAQVRQNSQPITYNTTDNGTTTQVDYNSPIGPGILHVFESMGYSTVLVPRTYPAAESGDKMWVPTQVTCQTVSTKSEASSRGRSIGAWVWAGIFTAWMSMIV